MGRSRAGSAHGPLVRIGMDPAGFPLTPEQPKALMASSVTLRRARKGAWQIPIGEAAAPLLTGAPRPVRDMLRDRSGPEQSSQVGRLAGITQTWADLE